MATASIQNYKFPSLHSFFRIYYVSFRNKVKARILCKPPCIFFINFMRKQCKHLITLLISILWKTEYYDHFSGKVNAKVGYKAHSLSEGHVQAINSRSSKYLQSKVCRWALGSICRTQTLIGTIFFITCTSW